ncbi:MAG: UDP-N-acetylmuramoyl-tripeptide--D-alanyl-D-alanine ligase, partial [Ktedonobacterales bacterium]
MIVLDDLLAATHADLITPGVRPSFEGFAHDSRAVNPGDCFVAVRGVHGDGHDYARDAIERGTGALLLERGRIEMPGGAGEAIERARQCGVAVLLVADTREALRRYAAHILAEWRPTVIAVTGSTGKTTTKEAIAEVLGTIAPTFRSWRNYNDLLGLPLSLGRLDRTHQFAVVELGADHPGEIADLCAIAHPSVGVVTNVSPTHLQYFGDTSALRDELARLPALLPKDSFAVLNADDEATRAMASETQARALLFAPSCTDVNAPPSPHELAVRAEVLPMGSREPLALTLSFPDGATNGEPVVFAHLHGDHWAYAVLAAVTVGEAFGVEREEALNALQALRPLPGRLNWLEGVDGMTLLDDSHNATPASVAAGLAALEAIAGARSSAPRIIVLGDMLRLGDGSEEEHRRLGQLTATHSDYLVTRGLRAETIAEEAV